MRIHLVFIGKTAFRDIDSAIGRYMERLQHYCPVEAHYIKAEKITGAVGDKVVRERESERILKLTGTRGTSDRVGPKRAGTRFARAVKIDGKTDGLGNIRSLDGNRRTGRGLSPDC